ncbi:hypothetical protein [Acidovorax carolinensis]|uniref:hypothetical protein n=1 Tax=Acidovorax carolinensis TaxID=553814 RepID=UPI000B345E6C|nr:hypothetical protein [Acidovorax carolinensis]ART48950.1 hypothetical protein CBP33_13150 [Acidovorax carolinensis]
MPAQQQTIAVLGAPGTGAAELAEAINCRLTDSSMTAQAIAVADDAQLPAPIRHTLHSAAIALLMGLDTPCPAPEQARREAFDAQLRTMLANASVRYLVVYGQGPRRTENALKAIMSIAPSAIVESAPDLLDQKPMRLRAWDCEKCSDPECEHRLFSALTGRGAESGAGRLTG